MRVVEALTKDIDGRIQPVSVSVTEYLLDYYVAATSKCIDHLTRNWFLLSSDFCLEFWRSCPAFAKTHLANR